MKPRILALGLVVLAVSACSDTMRLNDTDMDYRRPNAVIEFGNYVRGMTRASKNGANPFKEGESMGVWGYQTTDGYKDTLFNNQQVIYAGGDKWTYDNKKLWNKDSSYKFYGVFPYSSGLYVMDDENRITITDYVNPSDTALQKDLMISEMRALKQPIDVVDMIFHHIMSNVSIKVKISNNFSLSGIAGITLLNLHVSGIKDSGTYTQTGWTGTNAPVGEWSGQKGAMDIEDLNNVELNLDGTATPVLDDYIMIPQKLFTAQGTANDVMIDATFRIRYADNTSTIFRRKGVRLAGITSKGQDGSTKNISSWDPNCRYNYMLTFNPQVSSRTWDADGDGSLIINPDTGDTIRNNDDTPTPGTMRYDPDNPNVIQVFDDTDGDGKADSWVEYPIAWEDIDGDGQLEGGVDRDGDGHIDNMDNDNETNQHGDVHNDPTDGNSNNPDGKDCILVKIDTDGDGTPDTWVQLEKDPDTGIISPESEKTGAVIEFSATVQDWDMTYDADYNEDN